MTLAQLRASCKRQARIKSSDNLDDMVDEIILEVTTDYTNLARYSELREEGEEITLVAGQQSYDLPDDLQHIDVIRFAVGPIDPPRSPGVYRVLTEQTSGIKQTFQNGWPKYYRRIIGNKVSFWPFGEILATDSLLLDYFVKPISVFSEDADEFPVPALESAVKKDVIARLQRFYGDLPGAQASQVDARSSYTASRSGR